MTKYIIENLHDKERVESKDIKYKHIFTGQTTSTQWVIIK